MDATQIDALHRLALEMMMGGRPGQAVVLMTRALELARASDGGLTAAHAAIFGNLGNALQATGRSEVAIESYRSGLALAPDVAELHSNLGNVLLERGDVAAAIDSYRTALALKPQFPDCLLNLGNALSTLKQHALAVESYRAAVALRPAFPAALNNLGNAYQALGRTAEAVEALRGAAAADPQSVDIAVNLASALAATGAIDEAIERYRGIVAQHPDAAGAHYNLGNVLAGRGDEAGALDSYRRAVAVQPAYPEAHFNLAKLHERRGDRQAAEDAYRAALVHRPDLGGALFSLGNLMVEQGRFTEAAALSEHLTQLEPDNAEAHCLLGRAQAGVERFDDAVAGFRRALALKPDYAMAQYQLGQVLADCGQTAPAVAAFEAALALQPNFPEAHRSLGSLLQGTGDDAEAATHFAAALQLQPLITRPARAGTATFSVLMLLAPGRGNTPIDYFTRDVGYDSHILLFVPGVDYDADALHRRADVVFNLISDVDLGADLLAPAAALLQRIGRPVVNHPDRIRPTDRASIARRLAGLPDVVMPPTERYERAALARPVPGLALPVLLRPAGTHGGEGLELIDEPGEIAAEVAASPHGAFYLTHFVDYRAADGKYRKYRLMFVGDQILPYHLAIADDWKVHYYRTEMARHAWMRQEEAAFLNDAAAVFGERAFAALRAVRAAVGLEFFGIDCSLDRDGRLVVFEVNATMLIHDDREPEFAYKLAPVARIRSAVETMLAAARRTGLS